MDVVNQNKRKMNTVRKVRKLKKQLPLYIEKDEDNFYVVECPLFDGCYSQGATLDEALKNIKEVIELILEEKSNREILRTYNPREISLHTITI
jgi:predicted RNase H-like HicB family nuclease